MVIVVISGYQWLSVVFYGCQCYSKHLATVTRPETYPTNTLLATMTFLLLLDTKLLPLLTIHSYMTQQHSTKLLLLCKKKNMAI